MESSCHILVDFPYIWLPLLFGGAFIIGIVLGMKIMKVEKPDGC